MLLCGAPHDTVSCLSQAGFAAGDLVVTVLAPAAGFENLSGTDVLLNALLPLVEAAVSAEVYADFRERHSRVLDLLSAPGHRDQIGRLVPMSEAAALGTTRRISRESHTSSLWIDEAARLVANCALLIGESSRLVLEVDRLDSWDRPSLRVLYRAALISPSGAGRLTVRGRMRRHRSDAPVARIIDRLRATFFSNIAARSGVVVHPAPDDAPVADGGRWTEPGAAEASTVVGRAIAAGMPSLLRLVGDSLALQNFERVRLLIATALAMDTFGTDPEEDAATRVQLRRLEAICAAQEGDIAGAETLLDEAVSMTGRPEVKAHLYYLLALIATKRNYDLVRARSLYAEARAALAEVVDPNVDVLVERAWVGNGLALVAAMEGRRATDVAVREARFAEAYREELEAFATVKGLPGMSAFYLRYNLGYNLSFLMEITGRPDQAQHFLTSVSAVLRKAARADYGALYHYAIGLLRLRNGDLDGAAESLRQGIGLAEHLRDPFYLERMLSALGYVEHKRGRHDEAFTVYREGARLARWLRDEDAYREQLAGLLWSTVLGGLERDRHLLDAAARWFPQAVGAVGRGDAAAGAAALHEAGAELLVPSSKLPSYISTVDLEGRPGMDLNRFLSGVGTTERPQAVRGAA
ncbi:hypothetical protein [Kitasatospora mediocidica]|uniref:hypothetical protein n=1 Tax=Kitasatospora mediocidica TaxID=58352 RepID=UPI000563F4D6|nr:hypothetical protein [Kitasatospora mediocidica]